MGYLPPFFITFTPNANLRHILDWSMLTPLAPKLLGEIGCKNMYFYFHMFLDMDIFTSIMSHMRGEMLELMVIVYSLVLHQRSCSFNLRKVSPSNSVLVHYI